PGSSDINLERVEALKLAIRNGELKMDTGKIADALINEAQQDLQSNRSYDTSCRDPRPDVRCA
ncbi:flagellar biosynthesis anti-sigma factor FlgM, partial [Klebsiella pneumoniae]|uniref:flagellar biosynthesis anti-sigma factor FlgM n=1 Tax=Klebsiella pneumoniae TaxID=573 RepID=UPI001330F79E